MRLASAAAAVAFIIAAVAVFFPGGSRMDRKAIVAVQIEAPDEQLVLHGATSRSPLPTRDVGAEAVTVEAVHDATGIGVSEADVAILTQEMHEISRTRTGPAGRARVEIAQADWVRVTHPKFHERIVELRERAGPRTVVHVALVGRGSLAVTALGGREDRVPLTTAKVELELLGLGRDAAIGPLSTDESGVVEFPSLPLGSLAIIRVGHPDFESQTRRVDVQKDGRLTVELQAVDLLDLSIELAGYEQATLPIQRVALFYRTGGGTLAHVENLNLLFRDGHAGATLPWSHGAAAVVGQLACVLDESRVWEVESRVESTDVTRIGGTRREGQGVAIEKRVRWKANLRFDALGAGRQVEFLVPSEDGGMEPAANRLVHFAREDSGGHGALTTNAEGRVAIPAPAEIEGRFRFWVQRPGLVSQVVQFRANETRSEVVLGSQGGDLSVRGWRGSPDRLAVDEWEYGSWCTGIFAPKNGLGLVAHLPPGRYRLRSGKTQLGGFDYEVEMGETTVVDMSGSSAGVIHGQVPLPEEEVQLLRSASHVDRPTTFATTRSTATGEFVFRDLPGGSYVVTRREAEGNLSWLPVKLNEAEVREVGRLGRLRLEEVEITLLHEDGSPATDQGVVLWEAPKDSGVSLRLSPDALGVIHCQLPGRGDIAMFGPGWGAVLPGGTSPMTLRVPAGESEEEALEVALVYPEQREAIVMCRGRWGVVAVVRRVGPSGLIGMPREFIDTAQYIWDEGWGFYRVAVRRAERPQRVVVPADQIPREAHSCRVVLVRAGDMSLLPLGWHRSYALPQDASTTGLVLHVAPGWELQLDFLGGEGHSLLLAVDGGGATIYDVR